MTGCANSGVGGGKFRRKMIKGYIIVKGGYWVGDIWLIMPRICDISVPQLLFDV